MMYSESEFREQEIEQPEIRPYCDPKLISSSKRYANFVRGLDRQGGLHFTISPKEFVGIFFVWKKGER